MCYILKIYNDGGMKPDKLTLIVLAENQILLEIYKSEQTQTGYSYEIKELKPGGVPRDFGFIQSRVIISQDAQVGDKHEDIKIGIVHKFEEMIDR